MQVEQRYLPQAQTELVGLPEQQVLLPVIIKVQVAEELVDREAEGELEEPFG